MAPAVATYEPRDPSRTVLYKVIAEHLETFSPLSPPIPMPNDCQPIYNESFMTTCSAASSLTAFSEWDVTLAKKRCSWPSVASGGGFVLVCGPADGPDRGPRPGRVRHPLGATRQWVVSVPIPLRYWTSSSKELMAKVHTIIRTTISQYYVNQAVKGGVERPKVHPGSVTFIQRFGGAINFKVFDVDCAYFSEPLSFLLARLRHGLATEVLIPLG